jgi:hypothetical protein
MGLADRLAKINAAAQAPKADAPSAVPSASTSANMAAPSALESTAMPTASGVQVNPPESTKVLAEQTAPEMAGQPEPAEPQPEKKTRAKRGAKAADAQPGAPTAASDAASAGDLLALVVAVSVLLPPGASITIASSNLAAG